MSTPETQPRTQFTRETIIDDYRVAVRSRHASLIGRREVLTGQAGETVANRYRIARIGLESVDLEDVASGQSRRIPLRGN